MRSAWAWLVESPPPELEAEDAPAGTAAGAEDDDEDEAPPVWSLPAKICPTVFLRSTGASLLAAAVEREPERAGPAVPDRDDEPPRAVVCADAAPAVLVVLEVVVVLGALARVLWPSDLDTWATILAALMDGPRWPGGAPPGSGTGALGSEGSVSLTPG